METCPHGARIVVELGRPVVFLDECVPCRAILEDVPVQARVVNRETVPA